MPSAIDPTVLVDEIPASKADVRANMAAAKAELEHGGFAEGLSPTNYGPPATSRTIDHLQSIDDALGAGAGGAVTFTELADAPASYAGQANRYPRVKADETGLEFVDQAAGGDASNMSYAAPGKGAISRSVQDKLREVVSVRDFGAVGDNSSDDTIAINNAIAYALGVDSQSRGFSGLGPDSSWEVSGVGLYFPPGVYRWNATAIDFAGPGSNPQKHITLRGAGPGHSVIKIENDDYFINIIDIDSIDIEGIRFCGNYKGVIKGGQNVETRHGYCIHGCQFVDFTECAIGHESPDMPFWSIEFCQFRTSAADAICIALGGLSDESRIVHNEFWNYRYAIKNGNRGCNIYIKNNWFGGPASANEADIWLVPAPHSTFATNALCGTVIAENKFGNEGHVPGVPRIIVADEDDASGTAWRNRKHATTESIGWVVGVHIRDNCVTFAGVPLLSSFIKTWCGGVGGWVIGPNMLVATPGIIVEFDAAVTTDIGGQFVKQNTIFQPNLLEQDVRSGAGSNTTSVCRYSNQPWRFNVIDPYALFQGQPVHHAHGGVTDDPGVVVWMSANAQADGGLASATKTATTDPHGGVSATTVRFSGTTGYAVYNANFASEVPVNSPMFVEFDCIISTSQPLTQLNAWLRRGFSKQAREMARTVILTSGWQTVRIPFVMGFGVGRNEVQLFLQPGDFVSGAKTDVVIHNPRFYEARQPVNFGHLRTRGSGAWNGPHLVMGAYHIWIDGAGRLQLKSGTPTSATDGTIIGTQT